MSLETVVFQQEPLYNDSYNIGGGYSYWDSPLSDSMDKILIKELWETNYSSLDGFSGHDVGTGICPPIGAPVAVQGRGKRRRTKSLKNKEEMETQRMTHISVERNRRKLMNDYLTVLRSLMPPSYTQRGDQASVVGGAINFVKELEQLVQFLEANKQVKQESGVLSPLFANFFNFPQYSTRLTGHNDYVTGQESTTAERVSTVADIEVTLIESHANIKVLSRKQPKQLLKLVSGFYSLGLPILHLSVTTVDQMVLYSFSAKVENHCPLNTMNEIAATVHQMITTIQEEAMSS